MILKASQRGGGQDLAVHLLRLDDNEHIELCDLRGFACDDLKGAFKEAEAISLGTRCRQYLFSLSLSPPEGTHVSREDFMDAISRVETKLGLEGQPRAIVLHEKEGRRHAHSVWSRVDAETMTARQLSYFKRKLMSVSRDLYLEHGWKMPAGIERAGARNPTNFSLAEWQQAKRQGLDPRWLKETVQRCWNASDSARAFEAALGDHAMQLARGDKRSFVIVDHDLQVHSLPRALGLKAKDLAGRLGSAESLRDVDKAKKDIAARMTPSLRSHVEESRARFNVRSARLGAFKAEMTQLHRKARAALVARHAQEWNAETLARAARLPRGPRGLWHRITGQYQEVRRANELEAKTTLARQALERDQLSSQQLQQRVVLQKEFKKLRTAQAEQLVSLRQDIGRYLQFTRGQRQRPLGRDREATLGLRLQR